MESAIIDKLLESYFEGNTSLQQEVQLREYFKQEEVAPHLEVYRPMFDAFAAAGDEVSESEVSLPAKTRTIQPVWYSIAAVLLVAVTIGSLMFSNQGLSREEQEALAALKETKKVMLLMSEGLKTGASNINHLDEFNKGTSAIVHINQFTESKNRILK